MLLVFSSMAFAQREQDAIRARERTDNERMRGQRVQINDQTLKAGRDVDLAKVQKKNDEMNELVKSVNLDLQNLQKGVRAADLPKKLKQLEKLAKELRQTVE
jgi:hypothetical protein